MTDNSRHQGADAAPTRETYRCACCGWETIVPHRRDTLCFECVRGPEYCKQYMPAGVPDPRMAALAFLRPYVHRGDPEDYLRTTSMGTQGTEYFAQIKGEHVLVHAIHRQAVEARFSLHRLYLDLQAEQSGSVQLGLFQEAAS